MFLNGSVRLFSFFLLYNVAGFFCLKVKIVEDSPWLFIFCANSFYYSVLYMFLALCFAVFVNQYHIHLPRCLQL
jgi:hypothetical protein